MFKIYFTPFGASSVEHLTKISEDDGLTTETTNQESTTTETTTSNSILLEQSTTTTMEKTNQSIGRLSISPKMQPFYVVPERHVILAFAATRDLEGKDARHARAA